MITFNELNYVNSRPSNCPYPGIGYAKDVAEELKSSFSEYKEYYLNKKYNLSLSNGEQFDLEILKKNICHMLGVDFKLLTSEQYTSFREDALKIYGSIQSFDLLTQLVENIDDIVKYDESAANKVLNYYRIMVKSSIFKKISDFSKFNFGVINFDSNIYPHHISSRSTKYLYVQSNEITTPYFMMGILKESNTDEVKEDETLIDKYVVETLLAPTNPKDFFKNQEVCIPTQIQIITKDKMAKVEASASEKLALLNQYKLIISQYGLNNKLNIMGDYETTLADSVNKKLSL